MENEIRINKALSMAGICSRREADRCIADGRVRINGREAAPGDRVKAGDEIMLDGKPVLMQEPLTLLLFYKPRGIVSSTKQQRSETTVVDYLHYPVRVFPVGRLDKESEGLLLMTNQGELADRILRGANGHEKEYQVRIDRPVTEEFVRRMSEGVHILDTVTRPCKVWQTGRHTFGIILTQGLNRQIRRMCHALGCEVTGLRRIRILNLKLDGLQPGQYRPVTDNEYRELLRRLRLTPEDNAE
ncbi:MAG: pseudouridine synthase [Blautia sp.]|nr:pseudouridine synthase [Blautia sp.]